MNSLLPGSFKKSYALTPIQNSSNNSAKNTPIFSLLRESFLDMRIHNYMKKNLVTRNRGRLYNKSRIGHVECILLVCGKGLTPSRERPNLTFLGSFPKLGSICSNVTYFQARLSTTIFITASSLLGFFWWNLRSFEILGDRNMHRILGIVRNHRTTLIREVLEFGMYLGFLNLAFGHADRFLYSF